MIHVPFRASEQASENLTKMRQVEEETVSITRKILMYKITEPFRYADYPDPIRIDSENSQSYGCNC
jgi:hypothetical protein